MEAAFSAYTGGIATQDHNCEVLVCYDPETQMDGPPPFVVAVIICDTVIVDKATEKKTLVGIFDRVNCPSLPWAQPMGLYARMTDAEGRYAFKVAVLHLESNTVVGNLQTPEIEIKDRLAFMDLALNLPPVPFKAAGRYEFQIYANDIFIARATIQVVTSGG